MILLHARPTLVAKRLARTAGVNMQPFMWIMDDPHAFSSPFFVAARGRVLGPPKTSAGT